jgi:hypothetical protein
MSDQKGAVNIRAKDVMAREPMMVESEKTVISLGAIAPNWMKGFP